MVRIVILAVTKDVAHGTRSNLSANATKFVQVVYKENSDAKIPELGRVLHSRGNITSKFIIELTTVIGKGGRDILARMESSTKLLSDDIDILYGQK
ncbi:MAG TPA: hypothetical protein VLX29_07455 [Nitrospirota bacterium]|nr:hypothetical protein [Nitrospirota bacterium]